MGKRPTKIRVGAIPLSEKPKRILAAVFKEIEEYFNLLTVKKTNALYFGGYGIETKTQIKTKNLKNILNNIRLEDVKTLNGVLRDLCLCVTDVEHTGT